MKFLTKLWKRSQKSFATTIPHVALLSIDETKSYTVEWEFHEEIKQWMIKFVEKPGQNNPVESQTKK